MTPIANHPVRAAEAALRAAQMANDVAQLDLLLDDALVFSALDGRVVGKADDLAAHRARRLRLTRLDVVELHLLPVNDTVVVTNVLVDHEGSWDGAPVGGLLRYTRVWVALAGHWRIV
ncbi:MAG: DUF4440 domain-containing protein, partial [Gemmatimonadaceae bacterium]|nr:DUF4440 domain-containing protein [Gemmatimonadaceae bacterium]